MYIRKTKYEFFYLMCRNNNKEKEEEKIFAISFIIEAKSFINEGRKNAEINKSNSINASLIF